LPNSVLNFIFETHLHIESNSQNVRFFEVGYETGSQKIKLVIQFLLPHGHLTSKTQVKNT